jgi:hypothetical protein
MIDLFFTLQSTCKLCDNISRVTRKYKRKNEGALAELDFL